MHRSTFLILLGILVGLVSFMGLPYSWLMVLLPLFGLLIALLGYSLRLKKISAERAHIDTPINESHETYRSI
jgi:cytochrome c biogenesis factor